MGERRTHLAVDIQRDIELCILFQVAKRHTVGHAELALIIRIFPGQDLEQSGLARAVLAHNANAVFPLDTGRHIVQDDLLTKALAQFFQMNQHSFLNSILLRLVAAVLLAQIGQLFRLHHQRVQLFQRFDLIGGADFARVLVVAGVEPAGI